jgi:hypothetical protein
MRKQSSIDMWMKCRVYGGLFWTPSFLDPNQANFNPLVMRHGLSKLYQLW